MQKIIISTFLLLGSAVQTHAADLVFICHKGMGYSEKEMQKTFLAQLDEPHVSDNAALKGKMLAWIHSDEKRYKKTWDRNYFRRALNVPVLKHSDAEVIEFVASHGEGVGYVSAAPVGHDDVEVCGK